MQVDTTITARIATLLCVGVLATVGCAADKPAAFPCITSGDCPSGELCVSNACLADAPPCTADVGCPAGLKCDVANSVCVDVAAPIAPTRDDGRAGFRPVATLVPGQQPCMTDMECGAPRMICDNSRCKTGCAQSNAEPCATGNVCDTNTGRCVRLVGPCSADADCMPPMLVCEGRQCVPGCAEFAGVQCPGNQACEASTGRCTSTPCTADLQCSPPITICANEFCVGGCDQPSGLACGTGQMCDSATGRCEGVLCTGDNECGPPATICEAQACISGCAQPGAAACAGGTSCNRTTGRCEMAPACNDDGAEENDRRRAAATLNLPGQAGLRACQGDDDWFSFDAAIGDTINAVATVDSAEGELAFELIAPNGSVMDQGVSARGTVRVNGTASAAGRHFVHGVLDADRGSTPGTDYDLNVTVTTPSACRADQYEENDSAAAATPMSAGRYTGLTVCNDRTTFDDDFYAVNLTAGSDLLVELSFAHAEGNIEMVIEDNGFAVAGSWSRDNAETIWISITRTGTYYVVVYLDGDTGSTPGNEYEMTITVMP